jgi:thiol:disulfide interchange protein DsbD
MKKTILLVALLCTFYVQAQILEPVKWETSVEKISDTEYNLIATATIDKGWHLYSQIVPKNGPIPTTFAFEGNENYMKKGNTQEDEGVEVFDKVFNMNIKYFSNKAVFKQRIKATTANSFTVTGTVEFMACDDNSCLPPTEIDLEFNIN